MKRGILVHGWDGTPEHGWFPWLKTELEKREFEVIVPFLPNTAYPHIDAWIPSLAAAVGIPDKETFLVGHSMGCQAVARYLADLPDTIQVGGVVYVAGYFDSLVVDENEEKEIWDEWRNAPLDLTRVYARAPRSIAIFSDNDPYVPLENAKRFETELRSQILIQHAMGHYMEDDGCKELPAALEGVITLAQN